MRPTLIITAAASVAAVLTAAGPAWALASRTFVSGQGQDTNPCTLAAPCRSFAGALAQTAPGGEIAVLDTAGYGAVTINQSVSIVNPGGVEAGISVAAGGTAITIEATSTITVALRGLTLEGAGVGQDGIKLASVAAGGRLEIVNCVIRDFTHDGIYIVPIFNIAASFNFSITNTIVSDNGLNGIDIAPVQDASALGVIDRVQTGGNFSNGISVFGGNTSIPVSVAISNTIADKNGTGILVTASNATAYLAKNTIAGNLTAFSVSGNGALFSFGDNDIKGNGNDGPTISLVAAK